MSSYGEFLKIIKKAAVDAVNASNPVTIGYGEVVSAEPLKIMIDQKLTLSSAQLIIPERLTDYKLKMKESGAEKECEVFNALKKGEAVLLVREQGGQKFIVMDRMVIE